MLKKYFYLFLVSFFITSCSYFQKQTNKINAIQKVDTIVDYKTVDAFPLFPNCKDIPSREKQQVCFQVEMSQHIYASLKEYELNTLSIINDTVLVKLIVDNVGETTLSNIQISAETKKQLPQLDSLIKVSVQNLPVLEPALKRAMPVTTEFVLPIILKN